MTELVTTRKKYKRFWQVFLGFNAVALLFVLSCWLFGPVAFAVLLVVMFAAYMGLMVQWFCD